MVGWHGVPGEDVKELMPEIEMTPARDLATIDQHHIQFREAAGSARNALEGIHHQHQYAELLLHDLDEAGSRHVAELGLRGGTLARLHCVFVALLARPPQR